MTSKPKYISIKSPLNNITKFEGVVEYNIIHEIHCNIQANISTIHSEIGVGQYSLLGLAMQQATYHMVIKHKFLRPARMQLQYNDQGASNIMQPKWNSDTIW